LSVTVGAGEPTSIDVTIKEHGFSPIRVPTGRPTALTFRNENATAEEFDSGVQGREGQLVTIMRPCGFVRSGRGSWVSIALGVVTAE
jgi:hypothetical protein